MTIKSSLPLVILSVICLVLLILNHNLNKQLIDSFQKITDKNAQLKQNEEEINLCLSDNASLKEGNPKPYSFFEFGLSSPLFKDANIEISSYIYKRNVITKKEIIFEADSRFNGYSWGAEVWELTEATNYLKDRQFTSQYALKTDFPIFSGGWTSPLWVSDIMKSWQSSYINSKEVTMYWETNYLSKIARNLNLEFYLLNTPNNHQALAIIWVSVKDYNYFVSEDINNPSIIQAKEVLKKITDQISYKAITN